jgi:hypothetical protein
MSHRYTLDIEYNGDPAYHPITLTLLDSATQESREFWGKSLRALLKQFSEAVIAEEEQNA